MNPERNQPQKKVILITGPAGNLGSAVVETFHKNDSSLILIDRHQDRILERYPDLDSSPDHQLIPGIDLTDINSVTAAVNSALEIFGQIDCLVHTAGGFQMGEMVHEITGQNWDRMMDINVKTLLNICKATIPAMIKNKSGTIITIGSKTSLKGKRKMGAYSVAKSAVLRLTESIADEGKSSGITARCIIPGTIDTPQNRQAMPGANTANWIQPNYLAEIIKKICMNENNTNQNVIVSI